MNDRLFTLLGSCNMLSHIIYKGNIDKVLSSFNLKIDGKFVDLQLSDLGKEAIKFFNKINC